MDTKLTLKLDKEVIDRAKAYAERRGLSLSEMVERYFAGLTREETGSRPTGLVAELAGLLAGAEVEDDKTDYAEYL
ncbi:MAG: DUF6364 family protein, partial [Thermoanaerobaculia bacterium]